MKTIEISKSVLKSLYGDCPESLTAVFSEFLSNYAEIRENLLSSFQEGKTEKLKKFLHYHGPSFMYLGLPVISDYFKQLEEECTRSANNKAVSGEFDQLIRMVEQGKLQVMHELEGIRKAV